MPGGHSKQQTQLPQSRITPRLPQPRLPSWGEGSSGPVRIRRTGLPDLPRRQPN